MLLTIVASPGFLDRDDGTLPQSAELPDTKIR